MTPAEIVAGLRRAAVVCIEQGRICWGAIDVCIADATAAAASDFADSDADSDYADTPDHAATFLLLVAEASDAA
jgi:hypothetical protein